MNKYTLRNGDEIWIKLPDKDFVPAGVFIKEDEEDRITISIEAVEFSIPIFPTMTARPKKSCINCRYFHSYREIYEDPEEPQDLGWCTHKSNMKEDEQFGEKDVCENYKLFIKS